MAVDFNTPVSSDLYLSVLETIRDNIKTVSTFIHQDDASNKDLYTKRWYNGTFQYWNGTSWLDLPFRDVHYSTEYGSSYKLRLTDTYRNTSITIGTDNTNSYDEIDAHTGHILRLNYNNGSAVYLGSSLRAVSGKVSLGGTHVAQNKVHISGGTEDVLCHFTNSNTGTLSTDGWYMGLKNSLSGTAYFNTQEAFGYLFAVNESTALVIAPDRSLKVGTNGTASDPAYSFYSDQNTGMYQPALDHLALVTGGVSAITIDNSQNVGIGTSSPSAKLDVNGDVSITEDLNLEGKFYASETDIDLNYDTAQYSDTKQWWRLGKINNANISQALQIKVLGTLSFSANNKICGESIINIRIDSTSSFRCSFYAITSGYEAVRKVVVDSSGYVYAEIGYYFNVSIFAEGSMSFSKDKATVGTTQPTGTLFTPSYNLFMGEINAISVNDSGNVGIGTSSPDAEAKMHVSGSTTQKIRLSNTNDSVDLDLIASDFGSGSASLQTFSNHPLKLGTNNSSAVTIDTNQNVGIGTSTQTYSLAVYNSISVGSTGNSGIYFHSSSTDMSTATQQKLLAYNGTDDKINLYSYNNGVFEGTLLTIDGTGNVGIGTSSPAKDLHVLGSSLIQENAGFSDYACWVSSSLNDASVTGNVFQVSSARGDTNAYGLVNIFNSVGSKFFVSGNGNVGIGTASPDANLHIYQATTPTLKFSNSTGFSNATIGLTGYDFTFSTDYGDLRFVSDSTLMMDIDKDDHINLYGVMRTKQIYPSSDNVSSCGATSNRWTAVYAVNGSIQTSDINVKTAIERLQDDEFYDILKDIKAVDLTRFLYKTQADEDLSQNKRTGFILNSDEYHTPDRFKTNPNGDQKSFSLSDIAFSNMAAIKKIIEILENNGLLSLN